MFGWEKDTVIVHRISSKEKSVKRINLMLIEKGEKQHYCWVKRESALLFDKAINNKTFLLHVVLNTFHKSARAGGTRKVLQWSERKANKD